MSDIKEKQVLLGLSKEEISSLLPDCPKYTAAQIYSFLQDGKNFDEMTSLKKDLREKLKNNFIANPVGILEVFTGISALRSSSKGACKLMESVTLWPLVANLRILSQSPEVDSEILRSEMFIPPSSLTLSRNSSTLS